MNTLQSHLSRIIADTKAATISSNFAYLNISNIVYPSVSSALSDGGNVMSQSMALAFSVMRRSNIFTSLDMVAVASSTTMPTISNTSTPSDYIVALRSVHDALSVAWQYISTFLSVEDTALALTMSTSHSNMSARYKTLQGAPGTH